MIDKLETYGEWTYRMAWLLEITAALIGFSVAAVMIINGLEADTNKSGYLSPIVNAIGPAGAFVMVALAELTKIPLATLLFAADRSLYRLTYSLQRPTSGRPAPDRTLKSSQACML